MKLKYDLRKDELLQKERIIANRKQQIEFRVERIENVFFEKSAWINKRYLL